MAPRNRAWLSLLMLCAGAACQPLDVSQPIALAIADDWPEPKASAVAAAADCWNQRFGTQLGAEARAEHTQQVLIDFEPAICPMAEAATTFWPPRAVYICPGQYLFENPTLTRLFDILLHELGHVLNIMSHASGSKDVMGERHRLSSGYTIPPERFTAMDAEMFYDANPDFDVASPCEEVGIPHTFDGDTGCSCYR